MINVEYLKGEYKVRMAWGNTVKHGYTEPTYVAELGTVKHV